MKEDGGRYYGLSVFVNVNEDVICGWSPFGRAELVLQMCRYVMYFPVSRVCMYTCMSVCMYVRKYVLFMYVCTHLCM